MPFKPHAIIETGPIIRGQVFVAAVIGIERLKVIALDPLLGEASFAEQALRKVPRCIPAFGRPIGFTVNYCPNRAIRFDRKGKPVETLTKAARCGFAYLATVH